MKYFVTGHTGFKGSWLILLLNQLGHEVVGFSLEADEESFFQAADLGSLVGENFVGDIRDRRSLTDAIAKTRPDFGLHLAAQPLVLASYEQPLETFSTNVEGTLNFLEAWKSVAADKPAIVITSDKVYADKGKGPYSENDALGGIDPYSASKSMADILAQSWKHTHPDMLLGVARAGNVIAAFDHAPNRLLPDIIRAHALRQRLEVRNRSAVRPWQHVLDCLRGYLLYLDHIAKEGSRAEVTLNFGPESGDFRTVEEVINLSMLQIPELKVSAWTSTTRRTETQFLRLDSSLARRQIGWSPIYDFEESVRLSLEEVHWRKNPRELALSQIRNFLEAVP